MKQVIITNYLLNMESKAKLEINKDDLMAAFMGAVRYEGRWRADLAKCSIAHYLDNAGLDELKFSKSWDWLMPVVEKIESLGHTIDVFSEDFQVNYESEEKPSKFKAVFDACADIINKLSENKPDEKLKERFVGCLVGLAVGDAYGTTFEFRHRSQMPAKLPDEITGFGPFNMKPGEWTDDTSMALCLADSIIENGWNTDDQMRRYIKWWQEGYNSVTGECFDIGGATRNALSWYNMNDGKQFVQDTQAAGNGVLMRLAPLPLYLFNKSDCIFTLSLCAFQSIMTHPSSQSIECSMLMGAIINKILSGEKDKRKILNFDTLLDIDEKQMYKEVCEKYSCISNSRIESIKKMEYDGVDAEKVSGDGYCVYTLEAALWAFLSTDNFKDGLKKVVALGDDTDTTGAVYGQIAGAYYGLDGIPSEWTNKIAWGERIIKTACDLYELNTKDNVKFTK